MTTPADTPLDLEAIRARAEAATPGPWDHIEHGPGGTFMGCGQVVTLAEDLMFGDIAGPTGDCYPRSGYSPREDMAFIAAARSDVPALVDEVSRLRSELAAVQAERDQACEYRDTAYRALREVERNLQNALDADGNTPQLVELARRIRAERDAALPDRSQP